MTTQVDTPKQPAGFRRKVVQSTKFAGLRFASDIGLRLISTVILTRLLAPEIYGVFAVVMLYLYVLEMFSDLGLRSLILTREGVVQDSFLRTCWTVSVLRGLFIAFLSFAIAGTIGVLQTYQFFLPESPYSAKALPWALATLGVATFVLGFRSPMPFMHERDMKFGRITAVYVGMNIIGLIVTVVLAYYMRSVWAFVLGYAIKYLLQVASSFVLFPGPRMRFELNRYDLGLLIDRGKWILGHSILHTLSQAGDRIFLGFIMSSASFGFYFIARQLVGLVTQFLISINSQMGLQVFTHLQNSTASASDFRNKYYRYRLFFDAIAGLSVGGLIVLSPLLVAIVFDDRYQGVVPVVQVLIWSALLIGPTLLKSAFIAERRFKEMTWVSMLSVVTLWIGLTVSVFFFDSITAGLMVIALFRLPEAMVITLMGGDRDWVVIWREFISFAFCGVGTLLGLGVLSLCELLTVCQMVLVR